MNEENCKELSRQLLEKTYEAEQLRAELLQQKDMYQALLENRDELSRELSATLADYHALQRMMYEGGWNMWH